jgi:hypothetical protein
LHSWSGVEPQRYPLAPQRALSGIGHVGARPWEVAQEGAALTMQRTRRFLVALAGGAAVAAACAGSAAPASAGCKPPGCGSGAFPDASWRPYSATSTFNQRLGATSALGIDRSSSRIVGDLVNDRLVGANGGHSTRVVPENIGISRKGWLGWPTYYATAGQR